MSTHLLERVRALATERASQFPLGVDALMDVLTRFRTTDEGLNTVIAELLGMPVDAPSAAPKTGHFFTDLVGDLPDGAYTIPNGDLDETFFVSTNSGLLDSSKAGQRGIRRTDGGVLTTEWAEMAVAVAKAGL